MRPALLAAGALALLGVREVAAWNRTQKGWNLRRAYVLTADGRAQEQAWIKFRLLSWNCLAEAWTTFGGQNKELHEDLRWKARLPRILRELQARAPHIAVLQELEDYAYHWDVLPRLKAMGYHGIYSSSSQTHVGLAVLWKVDRFFLSTSMEVNLGEPFQSRWYLSMAEHLSQQQQDRYLLLSSNRVALFAVLVPRALEQKPKRHALLLCAAHLSSIVQEPPIGLDLQVFQAVLLIEALESMVRQLAEKQISVSVILAADLNTQTSYPQSVMDEMSLQASGSKLESVSGATVPSPVYQLFTQGFLTEDAIGFVVLALSAGGWQPSAMMFSAFREMLVAEWPECALHSAYKQALGSEPPTCVAEVPEQADYVLSRPASGDVARLALLGLLVPPRRMPYADVIRGIGSDHVPLVCDFALLRPPASEDAA